MEPREELMHNSFLMPQICGQILLNLSFQVLLRSPCSSCFLILSLLAFCLAPSQNHPADCLQVADCLQDEAGVSQHSNRQEETMVSDL